jgi:hypothetical protein
LNKGELKWEVSPLGPLIKKEKKHIHWNVPKNPLNKNLNQEQLLELVYQEFKYWFDPIAGKKENYENLSEAIYNWMKSVSL